MRALKSLTFLAILAAFFAFAAPAGAHTTDVTGVAVCSDGAHLVTWTITNNYTKAMTATASAEGVAYDVSGLTNPVPGDTSTHATSVVPGGVTGAITITVHATWTDGVKRTATATVDLPVDCSPTVTTSPPTTVPPTTVPPTTAPPTSVGVSPSTITPTTAPVGVGGVESGPGLASTGSSDTGAAVAVGLGLMVAGAGLVALKRRPAR
jgi:LPXTG-motif cell wall-anchored protein